MELEIRETERSREIEADEEEEDEDADEGRREEECFCEVKTICGMRYVYMAFYSQHPNFLFLLTNL